MMNNFRAASIFSKIQITDAEKQEVNEYILSISKNESDQRNFFEYCKKWKLAPWLHVQLNRTGLYQTLNEETRNSFLHAHQRIEQENEKRNKEAVRFLRGFKENNIDVIILKGNFFAHTVYKDTGYKRMNDFDILIRIEDWDRIQDIYFSLGYIPLGFGWSGEKQKAAKFSHVGMSFISPDYSCIIGSQWGLKSPTTEYTVNIEEAWNTALPFDFFDVPVKRLSPEFNLLHLILHMGIFKCGIRDCMDVYNYLSYERPDEKKFRSLIERSNAVDKTYFTLALCDLCCGTLKDLYKDLPTTNSFKMRRLRKRLKVQKESGDFQDSYNDYFQDIEKVVIYFNVFPHFHKKLLFYLIILKLIFFPKRSAALKLSDHAHGPNLFRTIIARFKAPYYIFALIAQEIGWKFTFLLFLKLFIDLILSIKNYIIHKESYFDYLRKKGIDPKEIEKAVKNIQ